MLLGIFTLLQTDPYNRSKCFSHLRPCWFVVHLFKLRESYQSSRKSLSNQVD
jgi:hypothetical protein